MICCQIYMSWGKYISHSFYYGIFCVFPIPTHLYLIFSHCLCLSAYVYFTVPISPLLFFSYSFFLKIQENLEALLPPMI